MGGPVKTYLERVSCRYMRRLPPASLIVKTLTRHPHNLEFCHPHLLLTPLSLSTPSPAHLVEMFSILLQMVLWTLAVDLVDAERIREQYLCTPDECVKSDTIVQGEFSSGPSLLLSI